MIQHIKTDQHIVMYYTISGVQETSPFPGKHALYDAEIKQYSTNCLALDFERPLMQSPRVASLCTCPILPNTSTISWHLQPRFSMVYITD